MSQNDTKYQTSEHVQRCTEWTVSLVGPMFQVPFGTVWPKVAKRYQTVTVPNSVRSDSAVGYGGQEQEFCTVLARMAKTSENPSSLTRDPTVYGGVQPVGTGRSTTVYGGVQPVGVPRGVPLGGQVATEPSVATVGSRGGGAMFRHENR